MSVLHTTGSKSLQLRYVVDIVDKIVTDHGRCKQPCKHINQVRFAHFPPESRFLISYLKLEGS